MEFLVAWGVSNAVGFLFKDVFVKLAQDALQDAFKDYLKDFFKGGFTDTLDIAKLRALKVAYGQANKLFVELVQDELQEAGLSDSAIQQDYRDAIAKFIHCKSVREPLGQPLEAALGSSFDESLALDRRLTQLWSELDLHPLPSEFRWQKVVNKYSHRVKAIPRESSDLLSIYNAVNQQRVSDLLEKTLPVAPDFEFTTYQKCLIDTCSHLRLNNLDTGNDNDKYTLQLWNIFVPQKVREQTHSQPTADSVLEILNPTSPYQYSVILGNPGSGKSTLAQYKALQWARTSPRDLSNQELPLLIELRNYIENIQKQRCHNFLDYFHHAHGVIGGNLNQQKVDEWLRNSHNQTIVIFDGLDEILNEQERENVVLDIISFKNNYRQARVMVTSRVIGYQNHPNQQLFRNAGFREFMLQDLDAEQIRNFVSRWHELAFEDKSEAEKRRQRLQTSIEKSRAFGELAKNPLLLTMMAILNRHAELPRDKSTLYEQASEVLLHRWDCQRHLSDDKLDPEVNQYLDYKDKREMLRLVAHRMQAPDATLANSISQDDLEDTLAHYLQDKFPQKAKLAARGLRQVLTTRSFVLCFFGGDSYGFVHRTFLEYFCALYFVEQYEKKRLIDLEYLKQEVFGKRWRDDSWHEVLTLIVSQLYEDFAAEIIDYLIEQDGNASCFSNLFLAQNCLSNVRNYRQLQPTADKLVERFKQLVQSQNGVTDDVRNEAVKAIDELEELRDKA
jgi:predicted NACHT family NTPase